MTVRELWRRILGVAGVGPRQGDLARELAFHREMLEQRHRASGLDADAARRAAAIELGNAAHIAESWRDQRGLPFVDTLRQDIVYGLRSLRGSGGFTAAVVATLALGIGANTIVFSVVDGVLLRRLPYAEPDRLVTVGDRNPDGFSSNVGFATVVDWRARSRSFADIAAMRRWMPTLIAGGESERLPAVRVSWNYFQVLGVEPLLGRTFVAEEDRPNDWFTVVLSEGLWRRRFGADRAIIGRSITLNDGAFRVVGVMPATFQALDAERYYHESPQLWAALGYDPAGTAASGSCRSCQHLRALARLRGGVSVETATAEMGAIREQLRREHPGDYETGSIAIVPLQEALTGGSRRTLLVLLGAVGFVLLIACANVASLQLARAAARQRELTLRTALGAGRGRIVRQLLTESLMLFAAGGVAAAALAAVALRGLTRLAPPGTVPRLDQVVIDGRVLAFTAVISALTGLLFGLAPAWRGAAGASPLVTDLRGISSGSSRGRALLAVGDLALALTLLVGAGLMLRTVAVMAKTSPGFDSDRVLAAQFSLTGSSYASNEAVILFENRLLSRLRALPEVSAAALAGQVPFQGVQDCWGFHAKGHLRPDPADDPCVDRYGITPGYLEVLGIPLIEGRDFSEADTASARPVILVSQATARAIWGAASPLGAQVRVGGVSGPWCTVIGVVGDVHHDDLTAAPAPAFYNPETQITSGYLTAVVRARNNAASAVAPVRSLIRDVDPRIPLYKITPLAALVDGSAAERVFVTRLLSGFAAIALLLAGVGLYGVLSFSVTRRMREFGVRVALGADRASLARLVLGRGCVLVGGGLTLGLVAAVLATRFMRTLTFGIAPVDPVAFGSAVAVLALVSLLAHWIPVRRALRVDPVISLRAE